MNYRLSEEAKDDLIRIHHGLVYIMAIVGRQNTTHLR